MSISLPFGKRIGFFAWTILPCFSPTIPAFAAPSCPAATVFSVGNTTKDNACNFSSIQAAIDATQCPNTTILITRELLYNAQHLQIKDKEYLKLYGATHCGIADAPNPPPPQTTISGAGHTGDSVVTIKGKSNIAFANLKITGGQEDDDGHGGGVFFDGEGSMLFDNMEISFNDAGYGAGIYMHSPEGAGSAMRLNANVIVQYNYATHDGGGLYLDGDIHFMMFGDKTGFFDNYALNGAGGGIAAISPAYLTIAAYGQERATDPKDPKSTFFGVVNQNRAINGGGIALLGKTDPLNCHPPAQLQIFTTDPERHVLIDQNIGVHGGAFYLRPNIGPGLASCEGLGGFAADLHDVRVTNNSAVDGAVAYLDSDTDILGEVLGSGLGFNVSTLDLGTYPPANYGAVRCEAGQLCNTVSDNKGSDYYEEGTALSIVAVGTSSSFYANRVEFSANEAENLINILGKNSYKEAGTQLFNSLIVNNVFDGPVLVEKNDNGPVLIHSSTFACNSAAFNDLIVHSTLDLQTTIIDDDHPLAGDVVYLGPSGGLTAKYLAMDNPMGLPASAELIPMFPPAWSEFVDPCVDFRPKSTSFLIDFAPPGSGALDIDGNKRSVDRSNSNLFGPMDLGAYELP